MDNLTDKEILDKINLIKLAIHDYDNDLLTSYSLLIAISLVICQQSEPVQDNIEFAKQLESIM